MIPTLDENSQFLVCYQFMQTNVALNAKIELKLALAKYKFVTRFWKITHMGANDTVNI